MSRNPKTLEGQAVRLADKIAYINHDIDDAIVGGFITEKDLPKKEIKLLGKTSGKRINTMISSVMKESDGKNCVAMEEEVLTATMNLRKFLFERVYGDKRFAIEEEKAARMITALYEYFASNVKAMPEFYVSLLDNYDIDTVLCDYISSMSDVYVVKTFTELFIPNKWSI